MNFDENIPENKYNKSLSLAKNGDFSQAIKNLPENMEVSPERLFELEWDLKWKNNFWTGEVIFSYKKSIEIVENDRIRQKIAFLENEKNNEKSSENSQENSQENKEDIFSELQEVRENIEKDQSNRQDFLDPYATSFENYRNDMKNIKNLLEENSVSYQKDW